jgi:hypothetical protein
MDLTFDPATTKHGYGAIDIVVNFYTPQVIAEGRAPTDETFRDQVRIDESHRRGLTIEQYIEKMDRAGIERSLLVATRCGDRRMNTSTEIPYEYVPIRTAIPAWPGSTRPAASPA